MRTRAAPFLAGLLACTGPVLAQEHRTILIAEHAGLARLLDGDKDRALADALAMVPARLRELPVEIPDVTPDIPAIANVLLGTLARPGRLAVTWTDENQTGLFGYGVIVSLTTAGEEEARQIDALAKVALAQAEVPVQTRKSRFWEGMTDMVTPMGVVSFGPRHTDVGWRYEILAGTVDDPDAPFAGWTAPDGAENVMRLVLDPSGLEPLLDMAQSMGGDQMPPEAADALDQIRDLQLVGPGAPTLTMTVTRRSDGLLTRTVITDLWRYREHLNMPETPLTPGSLSVIPSDATMASVGVSGWTQLASTLDQMRESGLPVDAFLDDFHAQTGVDLEQDVLAALGDVTAMHSSLSAGGGSIMSGVAMVSLRDAPRIREALARLSTVAEMAMWSIPDVGTYFGVTSWEHDGLHLFSLRARGLPMPMELTLAVSDDWLIAGMTPQGVIAAARSAQRRDPPAALVRALDGALPHDGRLVSVSYADTRWFAASGYAITQMLGTAIAGAVRSPVDQERDPGLIVPMYADLLSDVRPAVEITYWQGDDLIVDSHTDGSMLVNVAATVGVVKQIAPIAAGVAGAIAGAQQGKIRIGQATPADVQRTARAWRDLLRWTPAPPLGGPAWALRLTGLADPAP